MALPIIRMIYAPDKDVLEMLQRRIPFPCRAVMAQFPVGALGLIQTNIVDILYLGDLAQKAANVYPVELNGSCPQHITALALLGEVSAVETAMEAIKAALTAVPAVPTRA